MAKSSIINKKVLTIAIFVVIAIAVGVVVYMLTRPKANLNAPYNNSYDLINDTDYLQVQKYHNIVEGYLETCYAEITDEQANTNNIDKTEIKLTISKYQTINKVLDTYKTLDTTFLKTMAFACDSDGKMLQVQQNMTASYETLLDKLTNCVAHINSYLVEHKAKDKAYTQLYREIANYNIFYFEYLTELSNFYDYASQIFENYLVNTFDVNPISKQNIKTGVVWAKEIIANIVNYNAEFCTIENLTNSSTKLQTFTTSVIVEKSNYYSEQKSNYDTILNSMKNLDIVELVRAVARLNHKVFIEGLETEEQKTNATTLCSGYFGVN